MGNQLANPRRVIIASCLGLLLFTISKTTYSQDWIAKYDSLISESNYNFTNNDYAKSLSLRYQAYELTKLSTDIKTKFSAFILLLESYRHTYAYNEIDILINDFVQSHYLELSLEQKARLLISRGDNHVDTNRISIALKDYKTAYDYSLSLNDTLLIVKTINSYSVALNLNKNYSISNDIALSVFKFNTNDKDLKTSVYLTLFSNYYELDQKEVALLYLDTALKTALDSRNNYYIYSSYLNFSSHYLYIGDISLALENALKAKTYSTPLNYKIIDIEINSLLSRIYRELYEFEKSIAYSKIVYDDAIGVNNESTINESLSLIAENYFMAGDMEKANYYTNKLLPIYKEQGSTFNYVNLLILHSRVQASNQNYNSGLRSLNEADSIMRDLGATQYTPILESNYLVFPDSLISPIEKIDISKRILNQQIDNDLSLNINAIINLAINYKKFDSDSAFYFGNRFIELYDEIYMNRYISELESIMFSIHSWFYYELASWYAIDKNDIDTAFKLFEKSKSRSLINSLNYSQNTNLNEYSDNYEKDYLIQLQNSLDSLFRIDNTNFEKALAQLTEEEARYQTNFDIYSKSVGVSSQSQSYSTISDVQSKLDNSTAIIEFGVSDNNLFTILITKDSKYFYKSKEIEKIKDSLALSITNFRHGIINQANKDSLEALSKPLYDLLIHPLESKIDNFESLVIVPNGPIALLPFDSIIKNYEFLVERFTFKVLPSLTTYDLIKKPSNTFEWDILAIANPYLTLNLNTINNAFPLPYSLLEVTSVTSNFKKSKIIDFNTTEYSLKNSDLTSFRYIHFATHGAINNHFPNQSGLILSDEISIDNNEDGFFSSREIRTTPIQAELVILSVCNSGAGKVIDGLGLAGIQNAFIQSGTSSVISSLWSIYDKSTSVFMNKLYKNLTAFEIKEYSFIDKLQMRFNRYEPELIDYKTKALHQTKLDMIDHPYYNHPVHWASFIITGK